MASQIETALYTVATPIGNLADITLRALDVLKNVDVIACEDTRITSRLCEKYDIKTRLISYHKFSENKRTELFLGYLKEGKSVALVSDAGTPLVSDPGEILVKSVVEAGFRVIPICGASAVITLLQSVQRMGENFKFVGFLPRVKGQIEEIFLKNKAENLVFYQSPNRMEETLKILEGLKLEDGEYCNPKTHHAPVGAYIAKKEFGVKDEEILSAIRWHTLGKINMTTFEKIIFLADKLERKTRPCEYCEPIWEALNTKGLDSALLICYKNTIKSLVDRELKICTITVDIYNSLL